MSFPEQAFKVLCDRLRCSGEVTIRYRDSKTGIHSIIRFNSGNSDAVVREEKVFYCLGYMVPWAKGTAINLGFGDTVENERFLLWIRTTAGKVGIEWDQNFGGFIDYFERGFYGKGPA